MDETLIIEKLSKELIDFKNINPAASEFIEQSTFSISYDFIVSVKNKLLFYNKTTKIMILDNLRESITYQINEMIKGLM